MGPTRSRTSWSREGKRPVQPQSSEPLDSGGYVAYTMDDWDNECFEAFGEGRDPQPCPDCKRTGFYGPRIDPTERRYRQCRFCGFTQMVGGSPIQHVSTVHGCTAWVEAAKAPYIWWVAPDVESYLCPFCGKRTSVAEATVLRPVDDAEHPWWRVPQGRSRYYYIRFWENWEVTKGRVHL